MLHQGAKGTSPPWTNMYPRPGPDLLLYWPNAEIRFRRNKKKGENLACALLLLPDLWPLRDEKGEEEFPSGASAERGAAYGWI